VIDLKNRIEALKKSFAHKKIDGYMVADGTNLLYFTGFDGGVRLLVTEDIESTFYVQGVNYEAAKEEAKNCNTKLVKRGEDIDLKVAKEIKRLKLKNVGFDTLETSIYLKLKKALNGTKLQSHGNLTWELRKVKDETELKYMRKAAELTDEGVEIASETIRPGLREFEVAAEIEYAMRKLGSDGVAFDTIVASGVRSAFPHGGCTDKKIQKGDLVVLDMGAKYRYYRADLTRTFVAGKPSPKQEKLYKVVRDAQEEAFQAVKEGVKCADVDAVARKHIEKEGYSEFFVHGLGHGIGLAVHEMPALYSESKDVLKSGNVVTVEPGIYIVRFGGVRIEDTVLVGKNKGEKLTKASCKLEVK
jgi:Xaa-Pro aminopeptidase